VLPALTGASYRRLLKQPLLRRVASGLTLEGLAVAERAGMALARCQECPKRTVRLGEASGVPTPLNARVLALSRRASLAGLALRCARSATRSKIDPHCEQG
jgi:hypothetical protein